ncbi:hypothetical protein KSP39_PZI016455 [Platanthera zijinensis]|uniref:Uncharacterized protein n=1 Tax=Platanthera zijinensis TaxID=2320716 RepID=A0AAP0B689_9ASPA
MREAALSEASSVDVFRLWHRDFQQEMWNLVMFSLGTHAECSTPVIPVTATPTLGEDAPIRRPGKEVAEGSERDLPGRALFPGSASAGTVGEIHGFFRMELKRVPPLSFEEQMERATREVDGEVSNPEFTRKLVRWDAKEPRGGKGQEVRRPKPRHTEQQQQQLRWGRQKPNN